MGGLREFLLWVVLFTFSLAIFSAESYAQEEAVEITITEIMYDPVNSSEKEYVEVFTGDYNNLSGYLIADETARSGKKGNLTELHAHASGYALIVENGSTLTGVQASFYSVAKIGRGLNNDDGDTVFLFFPNGTLLTALNYTNLSAAKQGNSLQLINGTWKAAPPTPGLPNQAPTSGEPAPPEDVPAAENIILSPYLTSQIYLNVSYDDLFRIEIAPKACNETDYVTVAYAIREETGKLLKNATFTKAVGCSTRSNTGSFIPLAPGNVMIWGTIVESTILEDNPTDNTINFSVSIVDPATLPCDVGFSITMNETLFYAEGEKIYFIPKPTNTTFPFRIDYWIEDLFGKIVKAKVTTTNTNQKSWTAQSPEQDRVYFLKAQLYPMCQDTNASDNTAEKMLIVLQDSLALTSDASAEKPSSITITEITPAEPRFGDLLQVKLDITKGTTSKYAVTLWAESKGRKISAETKIHLREEDTEYALLLPVQLFPKCTEGPQDATLVVEGLDIHAEKHFTVDEEDGTFCSAEDSANNDATGQQETSADSSTDFSFSVLGLPASPAAGELLPVSVFLQGDAEPHDYEVWSYLYRGSKCYSCREGTIPREELLQAGILEPFEEKTLVFQLPVDKGMGDGDYNLKVKLRKDNQKTLKELTETISIEAAQTGEKEEKTAGSSVQSSFTGNSVRAISPDGPGMVVYESNTAKAQALTPIVLLVTIGLLALVLLRK